MSSLGLSRVCTGGGVVGGNRGQESHMEGIGRSRNNVHISLSKVCDTSA